MSAYFSSNENNGIVRNMIQKFLRHPFLNKVIKVSDGIFDCALLKNGLSSMAQITSKETLLVKYYNGFIAAAWRLFLQYMKKCQNVQTEEKSLSRRTV
jgi:hypothetical protein